jgi:hypothetical protein
MPLLTFEIESYTVITIQQGGTSGGAASGTWRILRLTSPNQAHGIRVRAQIAFSDSQNTSLG